VRTPLCDLLGIEAPVVLAPMGDAVGPALAAAVSNAGGLGMLPLTWTSPDEIAPDYRRRILTAGESDTFYGTLFDRGWPVVAPHRALRNSTGEAWERAGRPASGSRPGEDDEPASGPDGSPVNRYASEAPTAVMLGDVEPLPHWAGQGVGLVTREESAAAIVDSLVTEAEEVIESLGGHN
jgi:nitronate monooxygenase